MLVIARLQVLEKAQRNLESTEAWAWDPMLTMAAYVEMLSREMPKHGDSMQS